MSARMRIVTLSMAGALIAAPAHAFWGIGDVTFDPSNYAINGENFAKLEAMYETLVKQFDRLDKMQQTIQRANEAYGRLTNLDLHQMADSLQPGRYMKTARGLNAIHAARSELSRVKGAMQNDVYYVSDQLSRLEDLEHMVDLQAATANNLQAAATDLDQRRSSQIVAQSTSALAALASAEEQRQQQATLAAAAEHQQQVDLTHKSVELYHALAQPHN